MDDRDIEKLAEIIRKGGQGSASFDPSTFAKLSGGVKNAALEFNPFTAALGKSKSMFDTVTAAIGNSINTWQDLSANGANFNNDIVAMNVAAAGSRLSLAEFENVIGKNIASIAGLGTSTNQSAIQFAKLGKTMFDTGVADQLSTMGFRTKDINEILALQASFQRSTAKDTEEGRALSINSAKNLAAEMDAITKLTGKSRQEQMENAKKAEVDTQVRAKFLLLAEEDRLAGTNKAEVARANYALELTKAQAMGMGQSYKEFFAVGRAITQQAANEQSILGSAARAIGGSARALADGDLRKAQELSKQAEVAQMDNIRNTQLLTFATFGEVAGAAGKISSEMVNALYVKEQQIAKVRQDNDFKSATEEAVLAETYRRIRNEQLGLDAKTGEALKGTGTTQAIVMLKNRTDQVNSALMDGLVTPLNEKFGPQLKQISDKYLQPLIDVKNKQTGKVETVPVSTALARTSKEAFDKAANAGTGKREGFKDALRSKEEAAEYTGSSVVSTAGTAVGLAARGIEAILNQVLGSTNTLNTTMERIVTNTQQTVEAVERGGRFARDASGNRLAQ